MRTRGLRPLGRAKLPCGAGAMARTTGRGAESGLGLSPIQ
jgi:hypothetical protein